MWKLAGRGEKQKHYITVYTKDNQNNDPIHSEKNVVQYYFYYIMYFKKQESESIQ